MTDRSELRRFLPPLAMVWLVVAIPAVGQLPLDDGGLVNTTTTGDQSDPAVDMRANGGFTVVWTSRATGDNDIRARKYQGDGTPFSETPLNQHLADEQERADISVNAGGDAVSCWQSNDQNSGSLHDLFGRRTSSSGTLLADEAQLNETTAHNTELCRVARADDDSYVVSWKNSVSSHDLNLRLFAANGSPVTGDIVPNTTESHPNSFGALAAAPDGSFVVVWLGVDSDGQGVFARCYGNDGDPLGDEFRVNDVETGQQSVPDVAADARGAFVVVWRQGDFSTGTLAMRLFDPDCTPRSDDLVVESDPAGSRGNPRVDRSADGAFVVAWQGTALDADFGVLAREFTGSGAPVGARFAGSVIAAGSQLAPDVAISDELFVLVWADEEGESSPNDDILARRFRRRVILTDDFESGDTFYWTSEVSG